MNTLTSFFARIRNLEEKVAMLESPSCGMGHMGGKGEKSEIYCERFPTPTEGENIKIPTIFYYFNSAGEIIEQSWYGSDKQIKHKEFGNYFETKEKAETARDDIKRWLNSPL